RCPGLGIHARPLEIPSRSAHAKRRCHHHSSSRWARKHRQAYQGRGLLEPRPNAARRPRCLRFGLVHFRERVCKCEYVAYSFLPALGQGRASVCAL
ncbi:hypothetical protein GGI19_007099, partial [Coemansia pectinata]